MNKSEFIRAISDKAGYQLKDTEAIVNATLEVVKEALKADDKIALVGFGTFEVKDVAAKQGVNPATGEKIEIAACKKPVLKFSSAVKDLING